MHLPVLKAPIVTPVEITVLTLVEKAAVMHL
jgi:hypothetical protein